MKYGTFDIESSLIQETKDQKFLVSGLYYDGAYLECFSDQDLIDSMIRSNHKLFYAHNLDYDFRFLYDYLKENYTLSIILRGSKILKASVFDESKKLLEFRDSYALAPISLEKFTHAFSSKAKKKEYNILEIKSIIEYMEHEKKEFKDLEIEESKKLREYLRYDVISLYDALEGYKELFGLKNLALTIGNISFNSIKRTVNMRKINQNYCYDSVYRDTFAGGHVDVFKRIIEDHLFYFDFTSLYSRAMLEEYPLGLMKESGNKHEKYDFYIAEIETEIPEMYLPPLFYRYDVKLLFPTGKIKGWYNSIDLSLLEYLNIPFKINKMYYWDDSGFIFHNWVYDKYAIKQKGDELKDDGLRWVGKFYLNNGYGKWAEHKKRDEFYIPKTHKEYYNKIKECDLVKCPKCLNHYQSDIKICPKCNIKLVEKTKSCKDYLETDNILLIESMRNCRYTTTHIGSFITSYARSILYKTMFDIVESGEKIYYCDTDSIVTTKKLSTNSMLGCLKLEHEIPERKRAGYFALPKLYTFVNAKDELVIKAKGCKTVLAKEKDKIKVIDTDQGRKYEYISDNAYQNLDELSKRVSFEDIESFVIDNKPIDLYNIRISKQKSILRGKKQARECYKHPIKISSDDFKRVLIGNDSRPFKTSELKPISAV